MRNSDNHSMVARAHFLLLVLVGFCFLLFTVPGTGGGKKTLLTEVTVLNATGNPEKNHQVILEFDVAKGPLFSDPKPTDARGVASIKHSHEGAVKVWVDGDFSTHHVIGQAPGKIAFRLAGPPFEAIDRHALAAPPEAEGNVAALAKYLSQPASNDLEKTRAIYRWITDRIAYDFDNFFAGRTGDNSVEGVLKNRKGVCQGYAQLFEALAKKMGLTEAFITGYAKLPAGKTVNNMPGGPHAWNAVKIDGRWQLFDSTHGAGGYNGSTFVKNFSEFYFQARPEFLQFSHLPTDPKWQLMETPLTKQEFDAYPRPPREVFERGFSAAQIWKELKVDKLKEFCTFYVAPGRPMIFRDAPLAKTLKAGTTYHFLAEAADFPVVAFYSMQGQPVPWQRKGPLFEGFITPQKGSLKVLGFEQANGGKADFVLGYEVE